MPEFLSRPNLPNALANSLVQLASQEKNPLAMALEALGGLAETGGEVAMRGRESKEKFAQDKEMKKMEIEARATEHRAGLLTELVKNDQVVKSLIESRPMNATDAASLMGDKVKTQAGLIKEDFGSVGTPKVLSSIPGIPSEDIGLAPGFTITKREAKSSASRIPVTPDMVKKYPALSKIKDLSNSEWLGLQRSGEAANRYKGAMDDKLWARAKALADQDIEYVQASMEGDEAKIAEILDRKKRIVLKTGGVVGAAPGASKRKELGSIIADAFEKGLSQ